MLLKEKQPGIAVDMLIMCGKYDQALKILQNPLHKSHSSIANRDMSKLIQMRADLAFNNNNITQSLDLYKSIKDYANIARIYMKIDRQLELISIVR